MCRALDTPVTGGNVSFHNESKNHAVYPTPTIGMLGLVDDLAHVTTLNVKQAGDALVLLGANRDELGGSEYLKILHSTVSGKAPVLDIQAECALQRTVLAGIHAGVVRSAHDCAEGGLAVCLAEKAFYANGLGIDADLGAATAARLFGESQSRVVVSVRPDDVAALQAIAAEQGTPCAVIGTVVDGDVFRINGIDTSVSALKAVFENTVAELVLVG
jgi:phosphoribosylformylglycinamidine synthase